MASKPGPICQGRNPTNVNEGTLCSHQSPQPGVQGDRSWLGSAWDSAVDDAVWVAGKTRDGAVWVGSKAYDGAAWVGGEVRDGVMWTGAKAYQGYHYAA